MATKLRCTASRILGDSNIAREAAPRIFPEGVYSAVRESDVDLDDDLSVTILRVGFELPYFNVFLRSGVYFAFPLAELHSRSEHKCLEEGRRRPGDGGGEPRQSSSPRSKLGPS